MKKETLSPLLKSREAREDFAVRKARQLEKRKLELAGGAARLTGTPIGTAVANYYKAHPRLRERTLGTYKAASDKFLKWCSRNGVSTTDDVTRAKLLGWRESLINEPKRAPAKGGKRGARVVKDEDQRSAFTINRELASVRGILSYLGELDMLPRIKEGDLRRGLKKLPTSVDRVLYMKAPELKRLFKAVAKHDSDVYKATRTEHAAGKEGATPKYDPVGPFVVGVLLGGFRAGEALTLDVSQVDLEAGEVHLTSKTKTKRSRSVDLAVSPMLADLLAVLVEGRTSGSVWGMTRDEATAAMKRLRAEYGAPATFSWQALRRTCGTFLVNAPSIYGGASVFLSARRLGHSVAVSEKYYLGLERNIPKSATTIESAMQVTSEIKAIIEAAKARTTNHK